MDVARAYELSQLLDGQVDTAVNSVAATKLATAGALLAATTADTDAGATKVATAAVKASAAIAETDALATQAAALAAQQGIVALTPLTNAIATMKATPNQENADAVDALYNTAVTGVHDAILALDGLINAAKNASDTSAGTASTAKDDADACDTAAQTSSTSANTAKDDVQSADELAATAKTDTDVMECDELLAVLAFFIPIEVASDPRAYENERLMALGILQDEIADAKLLSGAAVQIATSVAERKFWDTCIAAGVRYGCNSGAPPNYG